MLKFDVPDLYVKDFRNDFKERQGSLFSALEAAEKEHSEIIAKVKNKPVKSVRNHNQRTITKSYRGKESIFKTPETPLSRLKTRNYRGKPHGKWTKYTLNDVSADDMSESSNSRAAFSFLRELQDRKRAADREDIPVDFKPVFKKPDTRKEDEIEQKNKKEFNFGEKPQKLSRKKISKIITADVKNNGPSNVRLNHLQFEEDDDDEC